MTFKPGDKVVCIRQNVIGTATYTFKIGEKFIVESVDGLGYITFVGILGSWLENRFVLDTDDVIFTETQQPKIDYLSITKEIVGG